MTSGTRSRSLAWSVRLAIMIRATFTANGCCYQEYVAYRREGLRRGQGGAVYLRQLSTMGSPGVGLRRACRRSGDAALGLRRRSRSGRREGVRYALQHGRELVLQAVLGDAEVASVKLDGLPVLRLVVR